MKFYSALNNFTSGVWSPKMAARTDTEQFKNACLEQKNMVTQIQGGSFRRGGTRVVEPLTYGSGLGLKDFQAQLSAAGSVALVPYTCNHGSYLLVCTNDEVNQWFVVDADQPWLSYPVTAAGSINSGSYITVMDPTTIQYAQVGEVLILVGAGMWPLVFRMPAPDNAELISWISYDQSMVFTVDGYNEIVKLKPWEMVPFGPFEKDTTRGVLTLSTGTLSVGTNVTVTFPDNEFTYGPANLGFPKYVRVTASGATAVIEISATLGVTQATGQVRFNPNGVSGTSFGAGTTTWETSLWDEQKNGFPRTVTGFEQRLYFAATQAKPETVWGSQIGNIAYFMNRPYAHDPSFSSGDYTTVNSRPYEFTLATRESGRVMSLAAAKSLVINTDMVETVASGTSNGAMGPLNISLSSSTSFGASAVQAIRVNNYLTFVQKDGRRVRDVVFSFEEDQYKSNDLAFVSDHLTFYNEAVDRIVQITKSEFPSSVMYCRTNEGRLHMVTLDRDYSVNAWATAQFGGSYGTREPKCLGIAVVTKIGANKEDRVFVAVQRIVDGVEQTTLEWMNPYEERTKWTSTTEPIIYTDCTHDIILPVPSATVTGLGKLEGETVDVFADAVYMGQMVVTGGEITLAAPATRVVVGLPNEAILVPMLVEPNTQLGSSLGVVKRVDEVTIKFWNSYGCEYGERLDQMVPLNPYSHGPDGMNTDPVDPTLPVTFFTGQCRVKFDGSYAREAKIIIRQKLPYPCNVLAVIARGMVYE